MLNIILEGGLVQAIESDDPDLIGIRVNILDLDSEGADDDDTDAVLVDDEERRAVIGIANVRPVTIRKVET